MLSATDQFTTRVYNIAVLPGDGIGSEVMDEAIKILKKIEQLLTRDSSIKTLSSGVCITSPPQCMANGSVGGFQRMVRFNLMYGLVGGAAWDKHGCHLPEETIRLVEKSDAVLFGSVGGPVDSVKELKWMDGNTNIFYKCYCISSREFLLVFLFACVIAAERNALLGLREHLGLGVNLRPAVVFPSMKHLSPLKNERIAKGVDLLVVRELLGCVYFGEHSTKGGSNHRVIIT